ncbi:hypothetical protein I6A84_06350 [Frankia sp. CNm7]|uniref:Putative metallopeptidase domain-containing protein n=1 Tax=Frankia nepalensis TaxID=1836974 RepID=A0A937UNI2_9ACTN|nr:hypothetical protein [Frankia nepalensis]MBL7498220.1 hypothetical protein [Frankia nepalensis]MBL7509516.1 hypothetical protein [Frankia nepalensis]MBL7517755.1 hypothetical protein [Frankia nepalensis]MBL7626280.1 hypothetical protein [Frankia nepalensis]
MARSTGRRGGAATSRGRLAAAAVAEGWHRLDRHPLFRPLAVSSPNRADVGLVPADGWAVVWSNGQIHAHPTRLADPDEWTWVFAHLLLHLGFAHTDPAVTGGDTLDVAHLAACDVAVNRFLTTLRLGRRPAGPLAGPAAGDYPPADEASLARQWRRSGVPDQWRGEGVAAHLPDLRAAPPGPAWHTPTDFTARFAAGLTAAVGAAIDVAGGRRASLDTDTAAMHPWEAARRWFISSYPLLGAVFCTLTLVADAELAHGWDIAIAAVSVEAGEVYVNPLAQLTGAEWRFVLAHEALHAALAHPARAGGRDPYLWNLACDFVINGWLVEMAVGELPDGTLHDPKLAGLSAETVYDRIAVEARRYRKLTTLRGHARRTASGITTNATTTHAAPGRRTASQRRTVHPAAAGSGGHRIGQDVGGDMVGPAPGRPAPADRAVDLDELLRRSLTSGLAAHLSAGRGLLPTGLVAEIRALAHPPIPWDVALARWFDEHFPALEATRSYARPSRRQAATPDIPRPGYRHADETVVRRTFGVVLDTSGSMNAELLGKALGAIASYATARDVPAARVVFCDAAAYDAGYLAPTDIAGRVRIRGRGGTRLQPGLGALDRAADFPADAPVLVITDGVCDVLRLRRSHAYLIPTGANLPFTPRGPVFRIR